jgi:hypothetical protein
MSTVLETFLFYVTNKFNLLVEELFKSYEPKGISNFMWVLPYL